MDVAANKDRIMPDYLPNYAGRRDVDDALIRELNLAGIEHQKFPESYREHYGEVKTIIMGTLLGWSFQRAWRYWIANGPGIPLDAANALHLTFGKEVRVDGHCGAPSPLEHFHGLAVGSYHIDTQSGLKALADTIKQVVEEANKKVDPLEISKNLPDSVVRAFTATRIDEGSCNACQRRDDDLVVVLVLKTTSVRFCGNCAKLAMACLSAEI